MPERTQYWPQSDWPRDAGVDMEFRSAVAFKLIEHWSVIAAGPDGEDSAGRAKIRLQTPEEVVARAFRVADAFVDMATDRGELRPIERKEREKK